MNHVLYEIHHIDMLANRDNWINRIHPLVKLIVTFLYIGIILSIHKYNLVGLIIMGIYPIIIFALGELSFLECLKKLRIVLPFLCMVGIFNPFFDKVPLFTIGNITVTTGVISMLTLLLKGIYSVLASYLLITTTTIEKICHALRLLHVPEILVTQILLTYRYISVLLNEANRMILAYSLRAPGQKGVHIKVFPSLAGQLLLKSMDRASLVYESMMLRGYKGAFYYSHSTPCKGNDYGYLVAWIIIFAALKFIPKILLKG